MKRALTLALVALPWLRRRGLLVRLERRYWHDRRRRAWRQLHGGDAHGERPTAPAAPAARAAPVAGVMLDSGPACTDGTACGDGGVCVDGACCATGVACGTACCAAGDVCNFQKCETPGADLRRLDRLRARLPTATTRSARRGRRATRGADGGACMGGAAQQTGKCLSLPPACAPERRTRATRSRACPRASTSPPSPDFTRRAEVLRGAGRRRRRTRPTS